MHSEDTHDFAKLHVYHIIYTKLVGACCISFGMPVQSRLSGSPSKYRCWLPVSEVLEPGWKINNKPTVDAILQQLADKQRKEYMGCWQWQHGGED